MNVHHRNIEKLGLKVPEYKKKTTKSNSCLDNKIDDVLLHFSVINLTENSVLSMFQLLLKVIIPKKLVCIHKVTCSVNPFYRQINIISSTFMQKYFILTTPIYLYLVFLTIYSVFNIIMLQCV